MILAHELTKRGLGVQRQLPISVVWEGVRFEEGYRLDLMVEEKVVVEVKSVQGIEPVHKKQLLTYLRLMDKRLGILINFNENLIRNGIKRVVNGLEE